MAGIFDFIGPAIDLGQNLLSFGAQRDALNSAQGASALQGVLAQRALDAQLAPVQDIYGNRTTYDPTAGWNTTAAPNIRAVLEQNIRNEQSRANELPGLAERRGQEGQAADSLLREFTTTQSPYSLEGVRADLLGGARDSVNRAYEDTIGPVATQAVRSGESGLDIAGQLASRRAKDLASAEGQARIAAPGQFESLNASRNARLLDPYNMLATRASNVDNAPFSPSPLATTATQAQANQRASVTPAAGLGAVNTGNITNAAQLISQNNPPFTTNINSLLNAFQQPTVASTLAKRRNKDFGEGF